MSAAISDSRGRPVSRSINAEASIAEFLLDGAEQCGTLRGDGDGGRIATRHFLGERGTAECSDPSPRPSPARGEGAGRLRSVVFAPSRERC